MIQKIKIYGKEIRQGFCTCYDTIIKSKKFDLFLKENFTANNSNISHLTEDKILKLVNEAINTELVIIENIVYFIINTKEYNVSVIIGNKKEVVTNV